MKNFKGSMLAFLGDKLASHAVGGFKESMSVAFRFCRTCMATHEQSDQYFISAEFKTRTPIKYKKHLLTGPLKDHYSTTLGLIEDLHWKILLISQLQQACHMT